MKNLTNATCTRCPSLKSRTEKMNNKLNKVLAERHFHLKELFDMKYVGNK